jgi:hypothetical protein
MADEKVAAAKAKAKVLDFTNVKDKGMYNPVQQEEGDYKLQIASVVEQDSKSTNEPMWVFGLSLVGHRTAVYPYYCVLNEDNLWKVRNLIEATGKAVPKKRLKFDPQSIVGKFVGGTLADDEYDGKMKSIISALFPVSELDDEDDEEEAPPPAKKKAPAKKAPAKKKKPEPEPEDDEDEDVDDEEDVDDDELEEIEVDEL